jgi:hypothetical protein
MNDIHVTAEQAGQLEVAWMLCAWPSKRKLGGEASHWWRESLHHILGYVPEGDFRVVVESECHSRWRG